MRIKEKIEAINYDETKQFFKKRAAKYKENNPYSVTMYQDNNADLVKARNEKEIKKMLPKLSITEETKVLDVACGIGRWADALPENIAEYCGLDFKAVAAICPAVDLLSPNLVMNINVPVLLGEKHRKSKYRKYLDVAQIISKDFPPYYVNTASGDFLRKQCYRLKELLDINKIEYKFHDFTEKENDKNLQHVFNVVNPFSPAGDQANTEITDFFKARMTTKAK